jgi:hypothetical protein
MRKVRRPKGRAGSSDGRRGCLPRGGGSSGRREGSSTRRVAPSHRPVASSLERSLRRDADHVLCGAGGGGTRTSRLVGSVRTTEDIDALVDAGGPAKLAAHARENGFVVESRTRLRHVSSGVSLDLLVAGDPMPRAGSPSYPSPSALLGSPRDSAIVGLEALCELKLWARRHRDLADIVELLKPLEDTRYIELEAAMPALLWPELARLRGDALEERALGG